MTRGCERTSHPLCRFHCKVLEICHLFKASENQPYVRGGFRRSHEPEKQKSAGGSFLPFPLLVTIRSAVTVSLTNPPRNHHPHRKILDYASHGRFCRP